MIVRRDIEAQHGVESLDSLHAKRDAILAELGPLEAKYEDWRIAEAERKIVLAKCELEVRQSAEGRMTDKLADAEAHAHQSYQDWVNKAIGERTRMKVLQVHAANITERVNRDNIILRYATQELVLQPRGN